MGTTVIPYSADAFATGVLNNQLPWQIDSRRWSDSTKEQYFSLLNSEVANRNELAMWRLNNEYNTPAKQMERLVAAGINPAAAYQNVSSGTSGSAPGVHESKAANWHDTSDHLNKVNTIMNGISQVISSIGSAVGSASGIQDMALKHQNNWYNLMRNNVFMDEGFGISNDSSKYAVPYQVAPGVYMDASTAALFPEFTKGFKSDSYNYDVRSYLAELSGAKNEREQGLYDKQMEVNNFLNGIFKELDSQNPNIHSIINYVLKLIAIQSLRRY